MSQHAANTTGLYARRRRREVRGWNKRDDRGSFFNSKETRRRRGKKWFRETQKTRRGQKSPGVRFLAVGRAAFTALNLWHLFVLGRWKPLPRAFDSSRSNVRRALEVILREMYPANNLLSDCSRVFVLALLCEKGETAYPVDLFRPPNKIRRQERERKKEKKKRQDKKKKKKMWWKSFATKMPGLLFVRQNHLRAPCADRWKGRRNRSQREDAQQQQQQRTSEIR